MARKTVQASEAEGKSITEERRARRAAYMKEWRKSHLPECRAAKNRWSERNRDKMREYQRAWKRRNKERVRASNRESRRRNAAKHNARSMIEWYVQKGLVLKMPCEVCGSTDGIQAHHDDYSKPLDVNWLCLRHHQERHGVFVDAWKDKMEN